VAAAVEWTHEKLVASAEPAPGAKIVIFAHHAAVISQLCAGLARKRWGVLVIDGGVPAVQVTLFITSHAGAATLTLLITRMLACCCLPPQRHSLLHRWRTEGGMRVMIVSVTAGGVGLDLTAAGVGVFVEYPPDVSWLRQVRSRPAWHTLAQSA
jgi:SNF2 family DNA or RNA helicase